MTQQQPSEVDLQLLQACKDSDLSKVRDLLEQGASPNFEKYDHGYWGSRYSTDYCVNLISYRENPLFAALSQHEKYSAELVKLLLKKGATASGSCENYEWRGCGATVNNRMKYLMYKAICI
jgi:hypothetical protein